MTTTVALEPLQTLYEAGGPPAPALPAPLADLYGGSLDLCGPRLVANFVATLDGAVAVPSLARSNRTLSAGSRADRFVMGLLRACADVVLIGSGTLHGSPRTRWTPEHAYPTAATAFEDLRAVRGQTPSPALAVLTGSGDLDPAHPALGAGATVVTTTAGAAALEGRLPPACTLLVVGGGARPDPAEAVQALRGQGHPLVLSEAGPHLFGSLLGAGLVDELFLTLSPLLAGRSAHRHALSLVEGVALLPEQALRGELLSVRRHHGHLFLRYSLRAAVDGPRASEQAGTVGTGDRS